MEDSSAVMKKVKGYRETEGRVDDENRETVDLKETVGGDKRQ